MRRISCVCEINNFCFTMLWVQLKPQMFVGIRTNALAQNFWLFGCRLSHCAKLWKLREMAVSGGKRPCRPLPTFPIEMCKTIFDSLSENHM